MTTLWLPHTLKHPIERLDHGPRDATKFIVIHVNDGTTPGTLTWWAEPGHEADGAHLQVSKDGTAYQTVQINRKCWHAGNANDESIGIEHEGWHSQSATQWMHGPQLHASANRCAWLLHEYRLGRPKLHGNIFPHGYGGGEWGGHPDCPGPHFPWTHYLALVMHGYMEHWGR